MQSELRPESEVLLECAFASSFENVSVHLAKLKRILDEKPIPADCKDNVLIVLGEVLNNIVEHAYEGTKAGKIGLKSALVQGGVHVLTVDRGPPIPPGTMSDRTLPGTTENMSDMPEGGFGWFIIHSLTEDMNYERCDGENRLTFSVAC